MLVQIAEAEAKAKRAQSTIALKDAQLRTQTEKITKLEAQVERLPKLEAR